ncbi:hypothetical protein C0991_002109 [Blastosporella zonata]|nr:hypothetical protein C0991_002109 [Blastosporella zonata]
MDISRTGDIWSVVVQATGFGQLFEKRVDLTRRRAAGLAQIIEAATLKDIQGGKLRVLRRERDVRARAQRELVAAGAVASVRAVLAPAPAPLGAIPAEQRPMAL